MLLNTGERVAIVLRQNEIAKTSGYEHTLVGAIPACISGLEANSPSRCIQGRQGNHGANGLGIISCLVGSVGTEAKGQPAPPIPSDPRSLRDGTLTALTPQLSKRVCIDCKRKSARMRATDSFPQLNNGRFENALANGYNPAFPIIDPSSWNRTLTNTWRSCLFGWGHPPTDSEPPRTQGIIVWVHLGGTSSGVLALEGDVIRSV